MIRFCVACEHHAAEGSLHICNLPITDLVIGETATLGLPCGDERSWKNARPGGCGPEGKNWKAKG